MKGVFGGRTGGGFLARKDETLLEGAVASGACSVPLAADLGAVRLSGVRRGCRRARLRRDARIRRRLERAFAAAGSRREGDEHHDREPIEMSCVNALHRNTPWARSGFRHDHAAKQVPGAYHG